MADARSLGDNTIMEHTRIETDDKGRERFVCFDLHRREIASEWIVPQAVTGGKGKLIMAWCESVKAQIAADIAADEADIVAKKRRTRDEAIPQSSSAPGEPTESSPTGSPEPSDDPDAYVRRQYEIACTRVDAMEKDQEKIARRLLELTALREKWRKALGALDDA